MSRVAQEVCLGDAVEALLLVEGEFEEGRVLESVLYFPDCLALLADLDGGTLLEALAGVGLDEDVLLPLEVAEEGDDGLDDLRGVRVADFSQGLHLHDRTGHELSQEAGVDVAGHVLVEEDAQEEQRPVECHEDAVVLELVGVQLQEVDQVEALGVDPEAEEAHDAAEVAHLDEEDAAVPEVYVEAVVQELEVLDQQPTFLVPAAAVLQFPGHYRLVAGEVLVADQVVEVGRKGDLEKDSEDRVRVVGQAPQGRLRLGLHLYVYPE